jgi:hypothetical protein
MPDHQIERIFSPTQSNAYRAPNTQCGLEVLSSKTTWRGIEKGPKADIADKQQLQRDHGTDNERRKNTDDRRQWSATEEKREQQKKSLTLREKKTRQQKHLEESAPDPSSLARASSDARQ